MKRLFLLFLLSALLLFAACGSANAPALPDAPESAAQAESVPTPEPDARELWRRAAEMELKRDSLEEQTLMEISVSAGEDAADHAAEWRFTADGLLGNAPVFQAINTGDGAGASRYRDGQLYLESDLGRCCAAMTPREALDVLR